MNLSHDEILEILKLMDESHFNELQLEMGDLKLVVVKGESGRSVKELGNACRAPVEMPRPEASAAVKQKVVTDTPVIKESAKPEPAPSREGLIPIKAPMLGIFYSRPEPGASPYIKVGTLVNEGDTVCMIEVMKCFTPVKAKLRGYIENICVQDSQMVEFGQELFLVKPAD